MPSSNSFFFNDTATTEIYTLSLHDALPISHRQPVAQTRARQRVALFTARGRAFDVGAEERSEEHTSELQSQSNLVCRLLLEKKNKYYRSLHRAVSIWLSCAWR